MTIISVIFGGSNGRARSFSCVPTSIRANGLLAGCAAARIAGLAGTAFAAPGDPGDAGANVTANPAVGGSGGDGDDGTKGDKGGNGGRAGSATATATTAAANGNATATATGGIPGAGGNASNAGGNQGAFGGEAGTANPKGVPSDNGNATATATATNGGTTRATASGGGPNLGAATQAAGGRGGFGFVIGGHGGSGANGGNANATATTTGNGSSGATAAGGYGGYGGTGGRAFSMKALTGGVGGSGGKGGTATALASTSGTGTSDAKATGGNGGRGGNGGTGGGQKGAMGGSGGTGGAGGGASARATTGNGTSATADATGGDGGNAGVGGAGQGPFDFGNDGRAGAGGAAVAYTNSNNNAGDTTAKSTATGGDGGGLGDDSSKIKGKAGSALAISIATASGTARATPFAETGLGQGGLAIGFGRAVGANGGVTATGFGIANSKPNQSGKVRSARATANAPIAPKGMGAAEAQGQAAIATSAPMLKPNTTLNAFASAIGDPLLSDVEATSAGKPNVLTGLAVGTGGNQLGLVWLGGLYTGDASGSPATFTTSANYEVNRPGIVGSDLRVGLQDAMATGNGFDSLDFQIVLDGATVVNWDFTSPSDVLSCGTALSCFDDQVLNLGQVLPNSSGLLDLDFDLAVTAHVPGEGFAVDLAFATVPEPPTWLCFIVGSAGLLAFRTIRRRTGREAAKRSSADVGEAGMSEAVRL
jgi:hypothetical protein